jgi:hypothetical protein
VHCSGRVPGRSTPDGLVRTTLGHIEYAFAKCSVSITRAGVPLLHHVGELMGQHAGARRSARVEFSVAEKDIAAVRKGHRVHLPAQRIGFRIVMNPYAREIATECAFHPLQRTARQRVATADARRQPSRHGILRTGGRRRGARRLSENHTLLAVRLVVVAALNILRQRSALRLFLACRAAPLDPRRRWVDVGRLRHSHHMVGDTVRFMLERIVDISYNEFWLNDAWQTRRAERRPGLGPLRLKPQRRLVADASLRVVRLGRHDGQRSRRKRRALRLAGRRGGLCLVHRSKHGCTQR